MKSLASILLVLLIVLFISPLDGLAADDKQQFCNDYATKAVEQYNLGKEYNLPGIVPPVWSNDWNAHCIWCMVTSENIVNSESAKRQAYLDQHIPKSAASGKESFCNDYATKAIEQYNLANQYNLPGIVSLGWSNDRNAHFMWCMVTPEDIVNSESAKRQAYLDQHIPAIIKENPQNPLAPIQLNFDQLKKISPAPDPIVPVFMHTLEKSLSGNTDYSPIEQAMLRGIRTLTGVQKTQLMNKWQQIPSDVRMATTPQSLQNLSPTSKVNMSIFTNALIEASASLTLKNKPSSMIQPVGFVDISTLQNIELVANAPRIMNFSPMGADGPFVRIGDDFTIFGDNFGNNPSSVKIYFLQKQKNGKYVSVGYVQPTSLTNDKITSKAITPALRGDNPSYTRLIVEVDKKFSAPYPVNVAESLNPTPSITGVEPPKVYPGSQILVTGKNIQDPLSLFMQALDQTASEYRKEGFNFNVSPAVISPTQFEFSVPQSSWSGYYKFNIRSGNSGYSDFRTFKILPTEYQVKFTKIKCLDESNEWSASDELVVAWVVIVDNTGWAKGSSEYEKIDAGHDYEFSSVDSTLIPAPGNNSWQPVRDFLYFRSTLYEWDSGDIDAYNSAIKSVGEIAPGVGAALGAVFGNPVAGKKIGEIIKVVGDGLAKLISWIGNDPDLLGTEARCYTAPELQQLTSKPNIVPDAQSFMNDDKTGSHILYFNIIRNSVIER